MTAAVSRAAEPRRPGPLPTPVPVPTAPGRGARYTRRHGARRRPADTAKALARAAFGLGRGLLFLAVCAIALSTSIGALLGFREVAVTSGSMRPVYEVGDALVVRTGHAATAKVGDVLVFHTGAGTGMVAHRIVGIQNIKGERYFVTRGDANNNTDEDSVPTGRVFGTVSYHVPWIGKPLYYATSGQAHLILLALLVLIATPELLRLVGGAGDSEADAADD